MKIIYWQTHTYAKKWSSWCIILSESNHVWILERMYRNAQGFHWILFFVVFVVYCIMCLDALEVSVLYKYFKFNLQVRPLSGHLLSMLKGSQNLNETASLQKISNYLLLTFFLATFLPSLVLCDSNFVAYHSGPLRRRVDCRFKNIYCYSSLHPYLFMTQWIDGRADIIIYMINQDNSQLCTKKSTGFSLLLGINCKKIDWSFEVGKPKSET